LGGFFYYFLLNTQFLSAYHGGMVTATAEIDFIEQTEQSDVCECPANREAHDVFDGVAVHRSRSGEVEPQVYVLHILLC
jgi:hypothetical protein